MNDWSTDIVELESALARLQTELNAADRRLATRLGFGSAEDLQVLRQLLRDGPQRVGVLAKSRGASTATVSARLDRLERRGLISRDRVPGDRRSVAATLTKPGIAAVESSRTDRLATLSHVERAPRPKALQAVVDALAERTESSAE